MHFLFLLLFYLGLLFPIKREILSLQRLYSLERPYKCVVSHRQSHHKNRFCCDLRAIDPHRVVDIPPARSEGLIARQKAARRKVPVSSWQPSPSTCRFISSKLSRNKLECDGCRVETEPRPLWLASHVLAFSFSHECIYNFMHVPFQIDSSLTRSSGLIIECLFKLWKMEFRPVGVIHIPNATAVEILICEAEEL